MVARDRCLGCLWVVLFVTASISAGGAVTAANAEPRIVGVYPNPASEANAGEFVVLDAPAPTNITGWYLTDDRRSATFPETTIEGRVAVSTDPAVTRVITELPVVPVGGGLRLANDGDRLTLATATGEPIDTVTYPSAEQGTTWTRDGDRVVQRQRFATNWSFPVHDGVDVEPFLLPDAPAVPIGVLENASDRIRLAGYQLSDPDVVKELLAAADAGIPVSVLVDGSPVSGQTTREHRALDSLAAGGVDVRVTEAIRDPYRFHHPKYAIVDDEAVVMTENWKPAGTGGRSSRGWGIRIADTAVAAELASVFDRDFGGPAAIAWTRYRNESEPIHAEPPNGTYPSRHEPTNTSADAVRVAVGPESIHARQRAAIRNASESIRIQQVSIGGSDFPLLVEAIAAAKRGVSVRVLLDGSWYVARDNEPLVEALNQRAAREDIPLEARIIEPGAAFEKIHAKGLVVDRRTVIVGSANWNNVSLHQNRELAIEIRDPAVGAYYAAAFDADWRGPVWTTPVGLAAVALAAWLTAGMFARRRIAFEP